MILIRFTGGLGNQMFQYALGTCLAVKNKTELKVDLTLLLDRSQPHEIVTHRELDIDIFNVKLDYATQEEIWYFNGREYRHLPGKIMNRVLWEGGRKKNLIVEKDRSFQPSILELPDNKCLVGSWQSERYFEPVKEELRKQFTFRQALAGAAKELGGKIQSMNAVCLNVRRGDYVTSPVYSQMLGTMTPEYFSKALELICTAHKPEHVFVFSDDAAWCKENLRLSVPYTIVGDEYAGPKYSTKLHLMTLCRHFIIPNSSYGWWAAWLGNHPSKMVIAPRVWFKDKSMSSEDLVPESWIRI
jgi:hypothetical protein